MAISRALELNQSLRALDLERNQISPEAVEALVNVLSSTNISLSCLNLGYIGSEIDPALLQKLKTCSHRITHRTIGGKIVRKKFPRQNKQDDD